MRGPVGSEIVLTIVREGVADPFDVTMTRDTIKLTAVRSRVEGDAVVLRVTTFNDQTYANLEEGLKKSIADIGGIDKVSGIVLDLRNNPGGLLTQAIKVSDAFLDKGEIVSNPRPQPAGRRAVQRDGGRPRRRQAHRRADQRRLGLGLRNRRRRAPGSSPRRRRRYQDLWQGLGPDARAPARRRRHAPHHRALLHALPAARSRRSASRPTSSSSSR